MTWAIVITLCLMAFANLLDAGKAENALPSRIIMAVFGLWFLACGFWLWERAL